MPRLRDLPWRRVRDPWAILVAEVMLQQTQAHRVIPKWEAFVAPYPTPAACAAASLGDVLRLWQGLGYPRRARNLHAAAAAIVERHGGVVPDDLDVAARAARHRAVHRTGRARVRVRTRCGGRRHQHRPGAGQDRRQPADPEAGAGGGRRTGAARRGLGVEPDPDGPRRRRVPADAGLRGVPASSRSCRWALARSSDARPGGRFGRASAHARARFEGSDRQARGRVLAALVDGAAPAGRFDERILASLVADGLVVVSRRHRLAALTSTWRDSRSRFERIDAPHGRR